MKDVVVLTSIKGKMHVFECPPWHVVRVSAKPHGASVHFSSGDEIATVQVNETPEELQIQLAG